MMNDFYQILFCNYISLISYKFSFEYCDPGLFWPYFDPLELVVYKGPFPPVLPILIDDNFVLFFFSRLLFLSVLLLSTVEVDVDADVEWETELVFLVLFTGISTSISSSPESSSSSISFFDNFFDLFPFSLGEIFDNAWCDDSSSTSLYWADLLDFFVKIEGPFVLTSSSQSWNSSVTKLRKPSSSPSFWYLFLF